MSHVCKMIWRMHAVQYARLYLQQHQRRSHTQLWQFSETAIFTCCCSDSSACMHSHLPLYVLSDSLIVLLSICPGWAAEIEPLHAQSKGGSRALSRQHILVSNPASLPLLNFWPPSNQLPSCLAQLSQAEERVSLQLSAAKQSLKRRSTGR